MSGDLYYVYGVAFDDVQLPEDVQGLDERPVDVVRSGSLAAVVSELSTDLRLGKRRHLLTHSRVLDTIAQQAPIVPLRFGTVVETRAAAVELLDAAEDRLVPLLHSLNGTSQYTVHARYDEQQVLAEIVAEDPQIADLHRQTRGTSDETTLNARLRLGELVAAALDHKRAADAPSVLEPIAKHAVAHSVRSPATDVERLVDAAFLVEDRNAGQFDRAAEAVARALHGRVRIKLVGPTAPYDFVTEL
ncbi:GvpL/GvpF family gas vesicle protein [Kribbella sp.]|uniref:GvpL/GvpF family gas vesicle protein n=1 Tax=Kribbella sp. TaxID=1871183 RepID=UPI002D4531D6|nr:GvpL/GvpF family gas vesicle protein [Kribbella sp.]HZX05780.1 GvpL/GvpF family gas vesicle protein [Kribbella sp.]